MSKLKLHAGDFMAISPNSKFAGDTFSLATHDKNAPGYSWFDNCTPIPASELEFLSLANEETIKRTGGAVGWGLVGAVALGPVGLIAGVILGSKGKREVTFIAKFKDGRKFIATTDSKTWVSIQAAALHLL